MADPLEICSYSTRVTMPNLVTLGLIVWVKVKVHTLDIVPLRSESPPQKHSGRAHVLRDFTVLPAHPHVHPQLQSAIPAFAFPAAAGTHLPTPEG